MTDSGNRNGRSVFAPVEENHGCAMSSHSLGVQVAAADIDRMGHINNSVYLRWIEEAVHAHWSALATPSEFAAYLWVAVRHEIDYRRPAHVDDHLDVQTRIVEIRRARAWFETVIARGCTPLVEARSCWCCVDAESRRLIPIPADAAARFMAKS
jgi:acyl-CoA thioester hydrolase